MSLSHCSIARVPLSIGPGKFEEGKQTTRLEKLEEDIRQEYKPRKEQANTAAAFLLASNRTRRGERCSTCGSFLAFAWPGQVEGDGAARLVKANFCHDRLCPHCARRRSLKLYGQMRQVLSVLREDCRYLFLTLTIPNVPGPELSDAITELFRGWSRLTRLARFKGSVLGYFRALEVTKNLVRESPSFGTYHPHLHAVLAVSPSYFSGPAYIKRAEWLELWRKAMRRDDITQVDVRAFRQYALTSDNIQARIDYGAAVAEATKYACKPGDLLIDLETFDTLAGALAGRRLLSWGGVLAQAHADLKQEDVEAPGADLALMDNEPRPEGVHAVTVYTWTAGKYARKACRLVDLSDTSDPLSPSAVDVSRHDRAVLDRDQFYKVVRSRTYRILCKALAGSPYDVTSGPGCVPGPAPSEPSALAPAPVQVPLEVSP